MLIALLVNCGGDQSDKKNKTKKQSKDNTEQPRCNEVQGLQLAKGEVVPTDYSGVAFRCQDNGKVSDLEKYKEGKKDGLIRYWHNNGKLSTEVNFKDGKNHGSSKGWYENGNKHYESIWKNGEYIGLSREWFKNGNLRHEVTFKDGWIKDGIERNWFENGQLEYEWNFKNGEPFGLQRDWFENGQVKKEMFYSLPEKEFDDVIEWATYYDEDGNVVRKYILGKGFVVE